MPMTQSVPWSLAQSMFSINALHLIQYENKYASVQCTYFAYCGKMFRSDLWLNSSLYMTSQCHNKIICDVTMGHILEICWFSPNSDHQHDTHWIKWNKIIIFFSLRARSHVLFDQHPYGHCDRERFTRIGHIEDGHCGASCAMNWANLRRTRWQNYCTPLR